MNVQLSKKPVYWYDGTTGEIRMGLPEPYPAPPGLQKIACRSAAEAELWSQRMRRWEAVKQAMEDEQREMIEGPMRANLRRHILHLAANARNNMNRDFLLLHLKNYEARPDLTQTRRESYLHSEAFERGH